MATSDSNRNEVRLAAGSTLGGRYVVERFLGSGATGSVYQVHDSEGGRFAAKVLHTRANDPRNVELVLRFAREAQVTSAVTAPNVVRVFDAATDPVTRCPFVIMELLCGENLNSLVERVGPLHSTTASRIIAQACVGLHAAHAHDIVHRDVKPSNLVLHQGDDGRVVVKLIDFGTAKPAHSTWGLTNTGSMLGTPMFMSPEQAKSSKHVDCRADVWSLGMTMYYALSGTTAVPPRTSYTDFVVALCQGEFRPLQEAAPWVDASVTSVVNGALAKDLAARYPSADAFRVALAQIVGGEISVKAEELVGLRRS